MSIHTPSQYKHMKTINDLTKDFLSQQIIAVVGVSSAKETVANGVYKKLKLGNRKTFAVGKNTTVYDNDPCFSSLSSLPVSVNGVFVAAKPENIDSVVDECIALNIPRVWIHNFGGVVKMTDTSKASVIFEQTLQKCRNHNIAVIPGTCPMMFIEHADFFHKCVGYFLSATGKLKLE